MRVHHLDCGSLKCLGGALVGGHGHPLRRAPLVCHVLLLETSQGLVLVDTGIGLDDRRDRSRLGSHFHFGMKPSLEPEGTAVEQLKARGFKPEDVRHIVVTHLDLDHAGGLPDFPHATVHVLGKEHAAAQARETFKERNRYIPAQWAHAVKWETYAEGGEKWFGFERVTALRGLPPEILLVPLYGHTRGHAGIAVKAPGGWLLHCGDAYFAHASIHGAPGEKAPPGLRFFERAMAMEREQMYSNQARLRTLVQENAGLQVFCAHDPREFNAACAAGQSPDQVKQAG